jgi:hypothetical protein
VGREINGRVYTKVKKSFKLSLKINKRRDRRWEALIE